MQNIGAGWLATKQRNDDGDFQTEGLRHHTRHSLTKPYSGITSDHGHNRTVWPINFENSLTQLVTGKDDLARWCRYQHQPCNRAGRCGRSHRVLGNAGFRNPPVTTQWQKIEQDSKAVECWEIVLRKRMVDNSRP
jgi:hypothetical protein